jgi:hypothetical protein
VLSPKYRRLLVCNVRERIAPSIGQWMRAVGGLAFGFEAGGHRGRRYLPDLPAPTLPIVKLAV